MWSTRDDFRRELRDLVREGVAEWVESDARGLVWSLLDSYEDSEHALTKNPVPARIEQCQAELADIRERLAHLDPPNPFYSDSEPAFFSDPESTQSLPNPPSFIRISEAARQLGVSRDTLKNWHKANRPGAPKLVQTESGRWYVDAESLREALERRAREAE